MIAVLAALAVALGAAAPAANAQEGEPTASWQLEQPLPPGLPDGEKSSVPIGLGRIGDIEFWAPNRGLLITAGNPPSIRPGIWEYDGVSWHELANVCGATEGTIAWAGPEEFWTVSDGRKGQSTAEGNPPLSDDTLCHFAPNAAGELEVVGSYASLAFLPSSYQAMHGAACLSPEDCWFGGEPLPDERVGAFHLHWNGHAVVAEPGPQGHAVTDLRRFGNLLYEGVHVERDDLLNELEPPTEPSLIHVIEPNGVQPTFVSLFPAAPSLPEQPRLPIYAPGESPEASAGPLLSCDAQALWAALDPLREPPESEPGQVTILRANGQEEWTQLLGPSTDPEEGNPFTRARESPSNEAVTGIAADPPDAAEGEAESEHAWLALASREQERAGAKALASVATISNKGVVSATQTLPAGAQLAAHGPTGYASRIACPAPEDCWLATSEGWLYHLAPTGERQLPEDGAPALKGLVTFRPKDEGVPQTVPDALPEDDSGLASELPTIATKPKEEVKKEEAFTTLPFISKITTRLIKGTTLEMRFHLSVKGKLRLLAKRKRKLVASTPWRTFTAGNRRLLLRLERKHWPTEFKIEEKHLEPLEKVPLRTSNVNTVSTGLFVLPRVSSFSALESRW